MLDPFPSVSLLIPKLKTGDEIAWNNLFEKFRDGLTYKTQFMLKHASLKKKCSADDLVQETYMKAWKAHGSFNGKTTPQLASWLITILRNTFYDMCRSMPPEMNQGTWFEFSGSGKTPSTVLVSQETEANLHACLTFLNPVSRRILMLRHFEGLKFVEIAERTGINANTVVSLHRRGMTKLTALLSDCRNQSILENDKAGE